MSWDWVNWLALLLGSTHVFDGVVFDESTFAKNRASRRWRAAKHFAAGAREVLVATGTLMPNAYEDLWAQSYLIDSGAALGSTITAFRERYMVKPDHAFDWEIRGEAEKREVADRIATLWVGLRADDYLTLPELVVNDVMIGLPPASAAAATKLLRGVLANLGRGKEEVLPPTVAAGLNKALQACGGFVYADNGDGERRTIFEHDLKTEALAEILEVTAGGVLVFFQFQEQRARLKKLLKNNVAFGDEDGAVEAWLAGKVRVLAAHPASIGHGLNLQGGGSTIVWLDLTYNLEHYLQANARLRRIGQQARAVVVHRIRSAHAAEQAVVDSLDGKWALLDGLMEGIKV